MVATTIVTVLADREVGHNGSHAIIFDCMASDLKDICERLSMPNPRKEK